MDRHWLALSIGTRCSLENHFIDDFFAVERMLGGCCSIRENVSFYVAESHLLRAAPSLVPAHVKVVDHPI
jgi:hypothetical protein